MSAASNSLWRAIGRDMLQSTVETGMWTDNDYLKKILFTGTMNVLTVTKNFLGVTILLIILRFGSLM